MDKPCGEPRDESEHKTILVVLPPMFVNHGNVKSTVENVTALYEQSRTSFGLIIGKFEGLD